MTEPRSPRPPRRPGGPGRQSPKRPKFSGLSKNLALWLLIILLPLTIYQLFMPKTGEERADITYAEFRQQMARENIQSVLFTEQTVTGELKSEARTTTESGPQTYTQFKFTRIPEMDTEATVDQLIAQGVDVDADPPPINWFTQIIAWLPWILIIALWIFFIRQMQGGGSRAFSFGKSKAKLLSADAPKVTFDDVAGADEAKAELEEIIEFLKDPKKFQRLGGRIPKGVLLLGPPGTGKTLLARAVAGEAGAPFFSMSGSDFVEMFVGVGASVTGDTPVLIRTAEGTELVPIGEFVDRHYEGDGEGLVVPTFGVETLGYDSRDGDFHASAWKDVRAVYRHRVDEVYEVDYPGGTVRLTGDHSVFVRRGAEVEPVPTRELKPGDRLVPLPSVEGREALAGVEERSLAMANATETTAMEITTSAPAPTTRPAWSFDDEEPVVREIRKVDHDGYVYDLCGCDNEAFFGGEKPVLLHNSRVRDLFEQGKAHAPCIIFIDEIDAVGRHRGAGLGGGHDEREQTLNQLLVEMDGFEANQGVILIAATNRPDVLDPALLRPGRFDRQVVVDRPDVRGRQGIFEVHMRDIPVEDDVETHTLAKGTPGLSGADIENIVNEAALLAARRNHEKVSMDDFEEAKDKVMMGAERKSLVISDTEKRSIAYHEAGHAMVRMMTPGADPVHKVTIIPRGRALGVTHFLPVDERHIYTRQWCENQLTALLGGRAAEVLVLKETTTGAGDDLQRATDLARRMVTKWGMSETLGPLTYGDEQEQVFLGREIAQHRDYSEETARLIDKEVKGIVSNAFDRARGILAENEDTLHTMADALLEREILDRDELEMIIDGQALPPEEEEPASTGHPDSESEERAEEKEEVGAALGVDDSARDPDHPTPEPVEEGAERTSRAKKADRDRSRSREPVARADDRADEDPLPSDT